MSVITSVAIGALKLYKRILSPVLTVLGVRCRHLPTCSDYAAESFRRHGAWRGGWLTLSRLCRCHPLGSHGWDPVPQKLPLARWRPWRYGDWAWTPRLAAKQAEISDDQTHSGQTHSSACCCHGGRHDELRNG
ncbi:MAG: membrane protein insertion efficiency factor YidD [Pseudomonadota bacterium]